MGNSTDLLSVQFLSQFSDEELVRALSDLPDEVLASLPNDVVEYIISRRIDIETKLIAAETDWVMEPADPIEFITGNDYCGFSRQDCRCQIEDFENIFYRRGEDGFLDKPLGVKKNLILFDGALGWGKSFETGLLFTYIIHRLLCLGSPQRAWGLAPESRLALIQISLTERHAQDVVLDEAAGKIERCKWFSRYNLRPLKISNERIDFKKRISIFPVASRSRSAGGYTIPVAAMDEASWHQRSVAISATSVSDIANDYADEADGIFQRLHKSMRSRFLNHWLLIVASSARHEEDFMDRQRNKYSARRYCYYVHRAVWDGRISIFIPSGWKESPEKHFVDPIAGKVPLEFKQDFIDDPEESRLHIAGIRGVSGSQFDTRWADIERKCTDSTRCSPIDEYGDWVEPLVYPGEGELWIHIDQSVSGDALGVAGVVVDHVIHDPRTKQELPVFDIVYYSRETGTVTNPIDLAMVRDKYVYRLSEWGWPIVGVSTDKYQHDSAKQELQRHGLRCKLISVDSSMLPYNMFKRALHSDRVYGLYDWKPYVRVGGKQKRVSIFIDEWRQLIIKATRTGNKVDHTVHSTKDVCDALVGAAWGAWQNQRYGITLLKGENEPKAMTDIQELIQETRRKRYWRRRAGIV